MGAGAKGEIESDAKALNDFKADQGDGNDSGGSTSWITVWELPLPEADGELEIDYSPGESNRRDQNDEMVFRIDGLEKLWAQFQEKKSALVGLGAAPEPSAQCVAMTW